MTNELQAKVKAVNTANEYANQVYNTLSNLFSDFIGQKIVKLNRDILNKIVLPIFPCTPDLHVFRRHAAYSLAWTVKTCELYEHSCVYHEVTVYVGQLNGQVLEKICEWTPLRTDYTEKEIIQKREAYKEAKEIADKMKDQLYPFGE
jgi:hypothetical protein